MINWNNPCHRGEKCPYGLKKEINKTGSPCATCDEIEFTKAKERK